MSNGRYLAELRRSSAAGIHDQSVSRGSARRDAINEQLAEMEDDVTAEVINFPVPLDLEDGPSDEEVAALDKEAQKIQDDFEAICAEYGVGSDNNEDYVPEPDAGDRDDYRVVSGDPEEDYEWTTDI